jgi:hypothetical protein
LGDNIKSLFHNPDKSALPTGYEPATGPPSPSEAAAGEEKEQ